MREYADEPALVQLALWLTDPEHWAGAGGVPTRVLEHLHLSALAVLAGIAIAVPIGLLIGHTGRAVFLATSVANIGRAIPSLALLVILFPVFGFGLAAPFVALLLLTIPPILTNTYVGVGGVDRDTVEAGRGMGLSEPQILLGVEVPLALPLMIAGVRTAAVQAVATATLAALIAGGGLGRYIVDGFALRDEGQLLAGALFVGVLAIATERSFGFLERRVVSPGLRASRDELREIRQGVPAAATRA